MNTEIIKRVLEAPVKGYENNVRGVLRDLLVSLWDEGESFDSKRPFGDSGWQLDIATALGEAGLIEIRFDEDGELEEVDSVSADELIFDAIDSIFHPNGIE